MPLTPVEVDRLRAFLRSVFNHLILHTADSDTLVRAISAVATLAADKARGEMLFLQDFYSDNAEPQVEAMVAKA